MGSRIGVLITGLVVGILALALTALGNPANMGVCIACFLRDVAGGLGLHQVNTVQYLRPEILGIILGASVMSLGAQEFRPSGGSGKVMRFILGIIMMIGMLVFLGCPLRVALRLGAGDLNALVGFAGLFAGVAVGTFFLKSGFSLGRAVPQPKWAGALFPLAAAAALLLLFLRPAFIYFSLEGPGSMHAPVLISLAAGLLFGILSQRSRFCMAGGIRDLILFRNFNLISGFLVIILVTFAGSLAMGKFKLGFAAQPIAHTEAIWNFLGLAAAGWAAALLGGCPLRQLVLAGQGNTDAAVTILGLITGAAIAHNFGLAASPKGVPAAGQAAVVAGLIILLAVSVAVYFGVAAAERRKIHVSG
ncbi:MAG: YedE-related selenium metabolism membrane protein [Firmicutes bacterium HGW-Firmicutes-14]|nr:MAG: YedE-related selenium metabolism membrane protein [Firmicutes bacterium HGW-Firmicutes-14]